MPLLTRAIITTFVSAVALTSCSPPPAEPIDTPPAHTRSRTSDHDSVKHLLELTNRSRQPLPPLRLDPRLSRAARDHSQSMARHQYFKHRGKDGSHFQSRMLRHGYPRSHSAENIAMAPDAQTVHRLWINSPAHQRNMMNPRYRFVGIARSRDYWTAVYAAPEGQ